MDDWGLAADSNAMAEREITLQSDPEYRGELGPNARH